MMGSVIPSKALVAGEGRRGLARAHRSVAPAPPRDHTSSGLSSEISFDTVCGESYLIRVGSYSSFGFGIATLDISANGESCGGGGCNADFNGDGIVDGADFGALLVAWGPCEGCPEDLDGDGGVDGADVGLLLVEWGICP